MPAWAVSESTHPTMVHTDLDPDRPKLGQLTPLAGKKNGRKNGRKGSPHVARMSSVHQRGHRIPLAGASELLGTIGDIEPFFGPFWA